MINTASNGPYKVCPLGFLEVKVTGLTYFLSIGNCLFKVFSLIYFKKKLERVYIKGILLGQAGFLHFSLFPSPIKILFFYKWGRNK